MQKKDVAELTHVRKAVQYESMVQWNNKKEEETQLYYFLGKLPWAIYFVFES